MPRHPNVTPSIAAMGGSVYSMLAERASERAPEVFSLHIGDTWLEPAPGCHMQDLRTADHPGLHRYAPVQGLPALIDAVVERTTARTGHPTERREVLMTAGATGGLGAVVGALVSPGDEVLLLAPYWPLVAGIVRSFHGAPVPVPFFGDAEVHDAASAVAAVAARRTDRTVALYLNTPNNPSGRVLPAEWLAALADWARRESLWILADEVYEDYVYQGTHAWCRPLAPERTFSAYSFSKAFGMAGNRCGFVLGPAEAMAHVRKVSTHTFYSTPTASQLAAARALAGPGDAWVADVRRGYEAIGREVAGMLGVPPPEGSTFLFFDVAPHLDERGLLGLLEDAADRGLLMAPGASFGPYPTHVRLCYTAAPPDVVRRGASVLAGLMGRRP